MDRFTRNLVRRSIDPVAILPDRPRTDGTDMPVERPLCRNFLMVVPSHMTRSNRIQYVLRRVLRNRKWDKK